MKRRLAVSRAKKWLKARNNQNSYEEKLAQSIDESFHPEQNFNAVTYYGADKHGNHVLVKINACHDKRSECSLFLILSDGRTYELPDHPSTVLNEISKNIWAAKDLQINVLENDRLCRVSFNGLLRHGMRKSIEEVSTDNLVHVRFNFIFIANLKPRRKDDCWSTKLKSESLVLNSRKKQDWEVMINSLNYDKIDQWGSMIGQIFFEDSPHMELFLYAFRISEWGDSEFDCFEWKVDIVGFHSRGLFFYLNMCNMNNGFKSIKYGHVREGSEFTYNVEDLHFNEDSLFDLRSGNLDNFSLKFKANENEYSIAFNVKNVRTLYNGYPWNFQTTYCSVEFLINNRIGTGLITIGNHFAKSCQVELGELPRTISSYIVKEENSKHLTISLSNEECQNEQIVGGKSASLSKLLLLRSAEFKIPKGFCVTAHAWQAQVENNKIISDCIESLVKLCCSSERDNLETECQKTVNVIANCSITNVVQFAILEELNRFNKMDSQKKLRLAIRSSAIGEDSEGSSSAGQNSTYLGVANTEEVLQYISHCWASLYSFRSVEYRRQQGLPINANMSVCIQEMVDADAAGVMFTRHPVTGNPKEIYLTSNYGLGETVVSGTVDPDVIIVNRNSCSSYSIKQAELGKRTQKMSVAKENGTNIQSLTQNEIKKISVTNETAILLAKIGSQLEEKFNGPLDIEWAVSKNIIYLLQARPITTFNNFSEFELLHELGSGVPNDGDIFLFTNVGEILPYSPTPLGSRILMMFNAGVEAFFFDKEIDTQHFVNIWFISHMKFCINGVNVNFGSVGKKITQFNRLSDIIMSGREVLNEEIFEVIKERFKLPKPSEKWHLIKKMFRLVGNKKSLKKINAANDIIKKCEYNFEKCELLSPQDLYEKIDQTFFNVLTVGSIHNAVTMNAMVYESFALLILLEGSKKLSSEQQTDIGILLRSKGDVLSAQVPKIMESISNSIREFGLENEFGHLRPSEIMNWLKNKCPNAYKQVQEFLKNYGHRGVMELDVGYETWGVNPELFLAAIQPSIKLPKEKSVESVEVLDVESVVNKLISIKKRRTKWLLKKIMPACHKAIASREVTKSLLNKVIHIVRMAYRTLGSLLVKDGKLPDEGLIFYLTHFEINLIISESNPFLVRKAIQRKKLHPKWKSFQFDDIYFGMPKPKQEISEVNFAKNDRTVKGMAVYNGIVKGRACVVKRLEDAVNICPGDILITVATDIGWTPYFALLSGVVTELGGLVSHGAVVAREYGLPCLVGAISATKVFKTGDVVLLNAEEGNISLIEEVF